VNDLWENLQKAFTHRRRLLRNHFSMILLFVSFVVFVYKNKGIVVGDAEAHRPKIHLVQFLYCTLVTCGSYFLAQYRPARVNEVFVKPFLDASLARKCLMLFCTSAVILAFALVIKRYTLVHPYTLADNRHYTFYVWSKVLGKSETLRLLLAIPYFTSLRLLSHSLSAAQSQLVVFAYFVCTLATVVFAELLEFRYFIVPFAIFGLLSRPMTRAEALGTCLAFALLNVAVELVFLFRPFTWPDGSTARFMW
jgi:alpha-1,2-glucosyltransferase